MLSRDLCSSVDNKQTRRARASPSVSAATLQPSPGSLWRAILVPQGPPYRDLVKSCLLCEYKFWRHLVTISGLTFAVSTDFGDYVSSLPIGPKLDLTTRDFLSIK